ncbi:MAG: glycosyltransferase family 4 protein [Komarekiella atlantica HA4396-MV6]|jgi:alpha-1,2-rhamnosyltransferase|nr:glycosyltransferase family 4 protein [Komarekiella atlantica HA4396-MV6]
MRIFIDCTHTAKHTYKNTGIHRVVRELTSEMLKLSSTIPDIEIAAVMFDGKFIVRVTNLNQQNYSQTTKINQYFYPVIKINRKIQVLFSKVKNKFINSFSNILDLADWLNINNEHKNIYLKLDGYKIQPGDIYIIADANWDLPKTYYRFLQILKQNQVTIVMICYDLIPIKFPEFSSKRFTEAFTNFYREYSNLFDQVLCISNNSVEDYKHAQQQGIVASNPDLIVKSFRLGSDYSNHDYSLNIELNNFDDNLSELLSKKYILVVGSLVPHKNIQAIITAFDLLVSNHENIHLLFAGNRGWHSKTDALIESNKMYGKLIHILGSVSDAQLKALYKNCYCLVQASFYEGFGLPVVEALQYCKPVVASTGGSLPEVGGDFCIYFDPTQPTELHQALKKLLDSDIYYNHLVDRIKNEYRPFSWKESAEQLISHLYS